MSADQSDNREALLLKGKLAALSAVIRLGHEAFQAGEFAEWANRVVNNSVLALPYARSVLADLRGGAAKVVAVSGAPTVNPDSEFVDTVRPLAAALQPFREIVKLTPELFRKSGGSAAALSALEQLSNRAPAIYSVPLFPPGAPAEDPGWRWLVELDNEDSAAIAPAILALLRENYQESLDRMLRPRRAALVGRMLDRRKWFRPSRVLLYLLIAFAIACAVVRIPQTVSAEFTVTPERERAGYAPFEGVIAQCVVPTGARVKAGDPVLRYDTAERQFNLNAARNDFARISVQLDLNARQAFSDPAKLAQNRLLELQKERARIDIERNEWFLNRSVVRAPADGVVDLGDAEKLEGLSVRPGERLFELLGDGPLVARVELDERNAAVLDGPCSVTLYLHTRPEVPIPGKVLSVSPKPLLTDKRAYCYILRAGLGAGPSNELFYGMRGIARVAGPRVTLGYYLFRHMVLWFRQL